MATETTLRKNVANYLVPYLGIKEGSDEHKALLKVFNDSKLCTRYTMTVNDSWCATAVSAAFIALGLTSIFPCVECSCAKMITLAKAAGIWKEDDSYMPSVGDVIMYDWQDSGTGDNTGTPDHVGIVHTISGTSMKIIEGNKSDTVAYRNMTVDGKYIRGYILPDYVSVATAESSGSESGSGSASLTAGAAISLKSASLYASATSTKSSGTKTGTFYIWSATQTNGRIRITTSAAYAGESGKITGWVNVSDITGSTASSSSSTSFAVGDKVSVTGTIYGNGNGTGGSIRKSGVKMYIVQILDSSKYSYYIGLAATKGGTRQGWAKASILTKV